MMRLHKSLNTLVRGRWAAYLAAQVAHCAASVVTYKKGCAIGAALLSCALISPHAIAAVSAWPANSWEAGRLDYAHGGSEVAAFVNAQEKIQLQVVLCSQNQPTPYRMSVLIPNTNKASGIIPVKLNVDGTSTNVYAEIIGNSMEFQVGTSFLITLPDSPTFTMSFKEDDAKYLSIPQELVFPMDRANVVLSEIAKSCAILEEQQNFTISRPLISGILWPRGGFNHKDLHSSDSSLDRLGLIEQAKKNGLNVIDQSDSDRRWVDPNWNPDIVPSAPEVKARYIDVDSVCLKHPHSNLNAVNRSARRSDATTSIATESNTAANSASGNSASANSASGNSTSANSASGNSTSANSANANSAGASSNGVKRAGHVDNMVNGLVSTIHMQDDMPSFVLSDKCKHALDTVYEEQGKDALSFLPSLFRDPTGPYQRYLMLWNTVLSDTARMDFKSPDITIDEYDYYLTLFSLFSDTKITQYPQSYYDILKLSDDPSTFIYAMDNRYELETIKYSSVLNRRLTGFVSPKRNAKEALRSWNQFYQDLSLALPPISKAQALRPVLYRQMLMRFWRLAGYPDSLHLRPEYSFVQGSKGKTTTHEPLEKKCAIFEGSDGDEFFYASDDCIRGISSDLRSIGYVNEDYQQVLSTWESFSKAWTSSKFYHQSEQYTTGEHIRTGIGITMLSMFKNYGFGDYFLLRKCISSRDSDICAYEADKYFDSYDSDFRKTVATVAEVSGEDARSLKRLNELWLSYYDSLSTYASNLVKRGHMESWRAEFVKGVAVTAQAESLISTLFYSRGESDEIGEFYEDDFQDSDVAMTTAN